MTVQVHYFKVILKIGDVAPFMMGMCFACDLRGPIRQHDTLLIASIMKLINKILKKSYLGSIVKNNCLQTGHFEAVPSEVLCHSSRQSS